MGNILTPTLGSETTIHPNPLVVPSVSHPPTALAHPLTNSHLRHHYHTYTVTANKSFCVVYHPVAQ